MVSLGVLTVIIGTIRVQGPKIARSLIGRARGNRALAEIELMSSTSGEHVHRKADRESTLLATQYQPQPYPEQTGGFWSDPGSPAGDYTGDTLGTICPNTCNPFNPAEHFCDITTGCATTGGSKYYCAFRAGFRANNYNAKDFSKQFKVVAQPYVYLAVSTSCNTPCRDQTCSEVLKRSQCK
ncbi:hypothetical protein BU25DRAFT_449170 [Macroventuria anomochaeta]|uniref:Uncharacterized protein n=1 Tax=Macroventuria anomochaeta TaxID=301207 RepID=A0ACB6RXE5_9PLEO|nr:uncharacterized protein BU25DRAFT_449170 [Macroventuria anomochaeta]KAF2626591.1 hypothetical protein BU25DRAFT_449170 [Macroventuria anomochaeta]